MIAVVNVTPFSSYEWQSSPSTPDDRIPEIRSHATCGERFGLRERSPHPAPSTPRPTTIAQTSTVFAALAPRSSPTPEPMSGTESPTKSAMSSGHRHAVQDLSFL